MYTYFFDAIALRPGELVTLEIDIESREFNGRWYTDVSAWKKLQTTI